MRFPRRVSRPALAVVIAIALSPAVGAQAGRVGGVVKDENGNPLKGATVLAENPDASPSSFTATTDEKGRFSIIGLRTGVWTFSAQAPGFASDSARMRVQTISAPNPPLTFALKKGAAPTGGGALAGISAKDIQAELAAADQAYNARQWDDSVQKYQAILAKAPMLTAINLQIAQAYRNKADDLRRQDPKADLKPIYDQAVAAYQSVLKVDSNNDKAKIGIGMTNLEKGDYDAAEKTLEEVAQAPNATREVFYNLGEVKFAHGKNDEAAKAYEKASELDPKWTKPVFGLAKVALNRGNTADAIKSCERVIALDPSSPDAVGAKQIIEQLKK